MGEIDIRDCRHISAHPSPEDLAFLDQADLILLSGGDVRRGWQAFEENGVKERLTARYYAGALLMGVSAGAVQLGIKGSDEDGSGAFDALRLVPFVVDVHDEPAWARLLRLVPKAGEHARGFGIPSGAGALYHPDYSVEPVRHPLTEVEVTEEGTRQALLFPGETAEAPPAEQPRTFSAEEILEKTLRDLDPPESGPDDPVN
jgi:cyanophycinase